MSFSLLPSGPFLSRQLLGDEPADRGAQYTDVPRLCLHFLDFDANSRLLQRKLGSFSFWDRACLLLFHDRRCMMHFWVLYFPSDRPARGRPPFDHTSRPMTGNGEQTMAPNVSYPSLHHISKDSCQCDLNDSEMS
jgi:hypothetical protein